MDKKLILAVAGSGKTYHIVQQLNEQNRFLLITYTLSGTENLRNEIINRFGYLPRNIKIKNYFSFLYTFCYKPFLADEVADRGISWKYPQSEFNQSYTTVGGYLYHNRIAKLITLKVINEVRNRLIKYYDYLLIDEIQDFGGNDFNFLTELTKANLKMLFVGDFSQHTFDTSRDRNTNSNLHKDINTFVSKFTKLGIHYDPTSLIKSRRCSKSTCDFIRLKLGINIESYNNLETECRLVTDKSEAERIFKDNEIVKLFLQKSYDFDCRSDNWGACKGLTYENVCIVLNDETLKLFNSNDVFNFKSTVTKNKFYVACSRSKNNLYFVSDKLIKLFRKTTPNIKNNSRKPPQ